MPIVGASPFCSPGSDPNGLSGDGLPRLCPPTEDGPCWDCGKTQHPPTATSCAHHSSNPSTDRVPPTRGVSANAMPVSLMTGSIRKGSQHGDLVTALALENNRMATGWDTAPSLQRLG